MEARLSVQQSHQWGRSDGKDARGGDRCEQWRLAVGPGRATVRSSEAEGERTRPAADSYGIRRNPVEPSRFRPMEALPSPAHGAGERGRGYGPLSGKPKRSSGLCMRVPCRRVVTPHDQGPGVSLVGLQPTGAASSTRPRRTPTTLPQTAVGDGTIRLSRWWRPTGWRRRPQGAEGRRRRAAEAAGDGAR